MVNTRLVFIAIITLSAAMARGQEATKSTSTEKTSSATVESKKKKVKKDKKEKKPSPSKRVPKKRHDLWFDYNFAVRHGDISPHAADSVDRATVWEQTAHLGLSQQLSNKTEFSTYVSLLGLASLDASVESAKVEKQLTSQLKVAAGRDYLRLGGYENTFLTYEEFSFSQYNGLYLPLSDRNDSVSGPILSVEGEWGKAGNFALQITQDVVTIVDEDGNAGWDYVNEYDQQPVAILEWTASFGPVAPLIQVVSYDINHSLYFVTGLYLTLDHLEGYIDYAVDRRTLDTGADEEIYEFSNIVTKVTYTLQSVSLFAKYSQMDIQQPNTDVAGNSTNDSMDDNSTTVSAGIARAKTEQSESFLPYLYCERISQAVLDPEDPSVSESQSQDSIVLGINGHL